MEWDNESIVKQIQAGEGNREELLEKLWTDNLGLIRKIIHRLTGLQYGYPPDREDFEDLEQQAFIGIMESIHIFDSTRGNKFFTLASHQIRYSIYRYYDRNGQIMRIPAYMRYRIKRYLQEMERLQKKGLQATDEIIMANIGITDPVALRQTEKVIQRAKVASIDSYLNEGDKESGAILDMIAGNENVGESAMKSTYDTELHSVLRSAIQDLPETEKEILTAYWYQGFGMKHIAILLQCTRQNAYKCLRQAYQRIRTGKYGRELATFLPERASHQAEKRIQDEFKELSEQERDLLI
ncbi:MAG: sigma-70 family RNA polymerase sigma factor [Blautia sp.]|nr:sigma-70 family RNA polymerase sigma factor [Blautia sp.]